MEEDSVTYKCTACHVLFTSTDLLKSHHKTDWHRYNLKRKLAGMSPTSHQIFQHKLELLKYANKTLKGDSHLKRRSESPEREAPTMSPVEENVLPPKYLSSSHSLFDNHVSETLDQNIRYMARYFSFFIPDIEYLKDKEGLIQYLGDKLYEGHQCLYCNRPFKSLFAVRAHMISKGHTSIGTNTEEQEEELIPFYDYSESYKEITMGEMKQKAIAAVTGNNEEENEWENEDEDEELADLIQRHGLEPASINNYGNLILPGGRGEAAHRSISYVYHQRLPSRRHVDPSVRLALIHARQVRALTESGEGALDRQRSARLLAQSTRQQTEAHMKQLQRFNLHIGMKANNLNRTILRAEKYFI